MGITENLLYPPEKVYKSPLTQKKDFNSIILWMLNYNEELEWSHFTNEPIKISQSTLSQKLRRLMDKGLILKIKKEIDGRSKKVYKITPLGKERFIELSETKEKGKNLNFPPKLILKKRNYDHWILWMLYNNKSCRWSDFKQEPISINQSSLSNNLNLLMEENFISKDNKEYIITPHGRTEYYRILKLYDLDRQSILEEESRRIEEITNYTNEFFNRYDIKDEKIKFRFLNNILKLDHTKVESLVKSKEEFNKIILFLSFNHPDQYPEYIIREKFCSKYDLSSSTLNFFVEKIVDLSFFEIKFFKLDVFPDKEYYFRAEEKIERMLRAIIDDQIARFTYLNKLDGIMDPSNQILNINSIINDILDEIVGSLFNENLRDSLRTFIPDYIKYLAYKIETEEKKGISKLESLFLQTMLEDIQGYNISTTQTQ
ncbi:MAG: transcriptional regulator, partial [Candidatus Lokiarchaeota archaeon]|nr:transcriptional regulator [Candidatus Lokiarchaeota archaeon]